MKRYYLIYIVLLFSCKDFLEENPESFKTPQSFFQNESEVSRAVNGVYNANRALFNSQLQLRFGETRSDNTNIEITGDAGGVDEDQLNEFTMNATNSNISAYWSSLYSGISRTNFILASIEDADFNNPAIKDFRKGETLFFRAWFHFNLVQVYGRIPYVTAPGETPEQINSDEFLIRLSVIEVYEKLLQDVQEAVKLLPEPGNLAAGDAGRTTKGAALMLEAKIQMAQNNYSQAIPLLEEILNMGYELLPNYSDVFMVKNNNENIFEIQYSYDLGQSSNYFTNFVPFASREMILGVGSMPNNRGNQFQPTEDLINLYAEGDERFSHNISFFTSEQGTFAWASKFAQPFKEPGQQDINFPMFRYADALLMLAETYHKTGEGDPLPLINQIRERAGLTSGLTSEEQEDLDQTIADERRRELAFEAHRFFDLCRTGKLVEVMRTHGIRQVSSSLTVTADAYQNIRELVGLPQNQVEQFGFEQNPGW